MKRILLAGVALLALTAAQPTLAADAPVYKGPAPVTAAPFNWSGFYIGVNGGYAWGTGFWEYDGFPGLPGSFNVDGGLVGGTIGWNWQAPGSNLVWGFEGDLDWTNIKGGGTCPNVAYQCNVSNSWLGTLRGRIGMAANTVLMYVTGGVAFGDVNAEFSPADFPGQKNTRTGWTIGAGVEVAIGRNWSAKAEYLYVDLGRFNGCTAVNCAGPPVTIGFTPSILRIGANVRF